MDPLFARQGSEGSDASGIDPLTYGPKIDEEARLFTVFTPTFNRAHTLLRLAESLAAQELKAFEWLVVDDGSTDNTLQVIREAQSRFDFPIRYHTQSNSGKHAACNRGVLEARGTLFYIVDSDDALLPGALKALYAAWVSIPAAERHRFSGVVALCSDSRGNVVGEQFPCNRLETDSAELLFRYHVRGEKSGFLRTDVMAQYPFPETGVPTLVPEGRIWLAIAKQYRLLAINTVVRAYHDDGGGSLSTLSRSKRALGDCDYYGYVLAEHIVWFRHSPGEFLKSAAYYNWSRRSLRRSGTAPLAERQFGLLARLLILITWPVSFIGQSSLARLARLFR